MSEQLVKQAVASALAGVVSGIGNVYYEVVTQDNNRKCARYSIVADDPSTSICGSDSAQYTYRVQVDLWDDTSDLVDALRQAAIAAITGITAFGQNAITHIGRNPVPYDEQVREARRSDDYYVHLSSP